MSNDLDKLEQLACDAAEAVDEMPAMLEAGQSGDANIAMGALMRFASEAETALRLFGELRQWRSGALRSMQTAGPVEAGAAVVAMDARRADELARAVKWSVGFRCPDCLGFASTSVAAIEHAPDCAIEGTKP